MNTWTPPEHFKGKRWRCWLCGSGFRGSDGWQEVAVYLGENPRTSAVFDEDGLPRASPKAMPVYVHDCCLMAVHESNPDLAKRIME